MRLEARLLPGASMREIARMACIVARQSTLKSHQQPGGASLPASSSAIGDGLRAATRHGRQLGKRSRAAECQSLADIATVASTRRTASRVEIADS